MKAVVPFLLLLCFAVIPNTEGATFQEARVSQVIQDVRLLTSNAAARQAVVNDKIREGTAVRTGTQSRAELTFADLTITRLGENTIFSLNTAAREIHVDHGSILIEVPPKSAAARITSAAVTAAVQGGTALFGTGPPTKFLVLEGIGTFYPNGHPEEAVTLHGGEMVMLTADGHLTKPEQFNVKAVLETSALIVNFPDLANLPLILNVINQQTIQSNPASGPPPSQDTISVISLNTVSNPSITSTPTPAPTPTPSKFGPPSTITSPNPYVITNGTTITTDPAITTNGVTNFGKVYQGSAIDGPFSVWAFGSTSAFDTESGIDSHINNSGAGFKFSSLELTGNPTVVTTNGQNKLGLGGVNGITSGPPGGTLTFAGIIDLLLATENGSITLGPEISFNLPHSFEAYARGSGSNLTLGSPVTTGGNVRLTAEGNIQVNGALNTGNLHSFAGTDFLAGTGPITATGSIDIHADNDVTFNLNQFPEGANTGQSVSVDAGHNINIDATGDQTVFSNASTISVSAVNALNMSGSNPTTLNLSVTSPAMFSAGAGGIQASTVAFSTTGGLDLHSGGNINVFAADIPFISGGRTIQGSINAAGALNTTGNVTSSDVTAGTRITIGPVGLSATRLSSTSGSSDAVVNGAQLTHRTSGNAAASGADLFVVNATAGTTIDVTGQLSAFGTITAGGNISAKGVDVENINAPNGILTVGSNGIRAFVVSPGGAAVQETFSINSIFSPVGIDYSGNQFFGIDGLSSGGKLTINATTLTFNSATGIGTTNFNGADSGAFGSGNPAQGGNGGTFIVNTTGDITANSEANITATTGLNTAAGVYSGAGGSVTLLSTGGMVTVNAATIQVSSDDSLAPRQSASGGTILLQSDLTTGQGITVGSGGSLLSSLNPNAPGPGGSITLSTKGSNITVNGRITADRGTITIDQNDPVGPSTPTITIDGSTLTSNTLTINGAGAVLIGQSSPATVNANSLSLAAQNADLLVQLGNSLTANGPLRFSTSVGTGATVSGADLTFNASGIDSPADYTNNSATDYSLLQVTNKGHITTGGNLSVDISGNLTASGLGSATAFPEPGDVELLVQNTNARIDTGGNLNLTVGGNVNVNGLALYVDNYDETAHPAGHIGTGGNIDVQVSGNLTTHSYVDVFLNNRGGGMIGSGGNLTFNVTGALTIGSDAGGIGVAGFGSEFIISSRYDDVGGNTTPSSIGSSVALLLHAASINMAGDLFGSGISNRGGSTINGDATATWDVAGNLVIQGTGNTSANGGFGDSWFILNDTTPANDPGAHLTSPPGGTINGNAVLTLNVGGDVNLAGDASFLIANHRVHLSTAASGGSILGKASVDIAANNFTVGGELDVSIFNQNSGSGTGTGGRINGDATLTMNLKGDLSLTGLDPNSGGFPGGAYFDIRNPNPTTGSGGSIVGNALLTITAGKITTKGDFDAEIDNQLVFQGVGPSGGSIGSDAKVQITATSLTVGGELDAIINNRNNGTNGTGARSGGTITGNAAVNVNLSGGLITTGLDSSSNSIGIPGNANFQILNENFTSGSGGSIGSDATIEVSAANISTSGRLDAEIDNPNGGSIGRNATVQIGTTGNVTADSLFVQINNSNGGSIGGSATVNFGITGAVTSPNAAVFSIANSNGGTIGSDAALNVTAASISTNVNIANSLFARIDNTNAGLISNGAAVSLSIAGNVTSGGLVADIENNGGHIGLASNVAFQAGGSVDVTGAAFFDIANPNGRIGSDATVNVGATSLSTSGDLVVVINDQGGNIGGNAIITLNASGDVHSGGTAFFAMSNNPGTITSNASVNVSAANISTVGFVEAYIDNTGGAIGGNATVQIGTTGNVTADSLFVQINNSNGGSIGGNATINMNVSGTGTVTNNATVQILGANPTGSAAINFNGGSYSVGGTFFSSIDGNGSLTFTNTDLHANVLKAGVFGANGSLILGGSGTNTISADTLLHLYAPGSNGLLKFVANVTLSSGTAMDLAANTITINPGVTVTIAGAGGAANIYTNNANYSGFGGNASTTGTFSGNGAHNPQPLGNTPGFGPPPGPPPSSATTSAITQTLSSGDVTSSTKPTALTSAQTAGQTINVSDSGQLLSLLDTAKPGPNGQITIPAAKNTSNSGNSSASNLPSRSNRVPPAVNPQLMRDRKTIRTHVNDPQPIARAPSA